MTKICAIGDSHIAAMILGWKQIESEYPETQFTFYGAPGTLMQELTVRDGSLVPATAELRRYFELTDRNAEIGEDYDCFLVCALEFNLRQVAPLYRLYRAEKFKSDERIPISDECFVRSVQGRLRKTMAAGMIHKLMRISAAPITLIPQPLPSEQPLIRWKWIEGAENTGDAQTVANLFDSACSRFARDLNVQIAFQPPSTKGGPLRTKAVYSEGSVRLRDMTLAHREWEPLHMNAEYGAVVLRQVLGRSPTARRPRGAGSRTGSAPRSWKEWRLPSLTWLFRRRKSGG